MRILVFGATGGTGRQLVAQALADGHDVTAFGRNPAAAETSHPSLRIVRGDAMDPAVVERIMPGHDAVISVLGAPATRTGRVRSDGTRNIVHAMERVGIRRFVCQTSLGYGDSQQVLDRTPFYFKYVIVPFVLRAGFADHQRQEGVIKESRLDWIIVRPGSLTDGPHTGAYRHGFPASDTTIKAKVSRADVADFMLKQLADDTYLRKTPGISY
jgi:putative NADH-flavin reductase